MAAAHLQGHFPYERLRYLHVQKLFTECVVIGHAGQGATECHALIFVDGRFGQAFAINTQFFERFDREARKKPRQALGLIRLFSDKADIAFINGLAIYRHSHAVNTWELPFTKRGDLRSYGIPARTTTDVQESRIETEFGVSG